MEVNIQSIHFDADNKLIEFIRLKAGKLQTYNLDILNAEVFLKISASSDSANKVVELKLQLPGHTLFASEKSKSFEEAIDHCTESVRRQLEKLKH
ncbi:MAG: ribosome-associated translation inhibitor RaiA [Sphingomonadales bacterium]|nr:ribosome-associated translation inhibitor RaiA [Sphingomonadales bacterium]